MPRRSALLVAFEQDPELEGDSQGAASSQRTAPHSTASTSASAKGGAGARGRTPRSLPAPLSWLSFIALPEAKEGLGISARVRPP